MAPYYQIVSWYRDKRKYFDTRMYLANSTIPFNLYLDKYEETIMNHCVNNNGFIKDAYIRAKELNLPKDRLLTHMSFIIYTYLSLFDTKYPYIDYIVKFAEDISSKMKDNSYLIPLMYIIVIENTKINPTWLHYLEAMITVKELDKLVLYLYSMDLEKSGVNNDRLNEHNIQLTEN